MSKRKLVMDIDTGVDDAVALLLALADPNVDLLAVTCVAGNTTLRNALVNTLRVLKLCNRLDIPVYGGNDRALNGDFSPEVNFHGKDGFGDTENEDIDLSLIQPEPAYEALINLANKNEGELTLFTSAPLTNIALALQNDPSFGLKLKECFIMGGNVTARGNIKICGEFNFVCDTEAAKIVLEQLQTPLTIIPMDTCCNHGYDLDWYEKLWKLDTEIGRFLKRVMKIYVFNLFEYESKLAPIYDAFAMATLLNPEAASDTVTHYVTIETLGEYTKSMMVIDWGNHLGKKANTRVVTKLDMNIINKLLYSAVNRNVK